MDEREKEILAQVEAGTLSPEAALRMAQHHAIHISEIKTDDLAVHVLDTGFPDFDASMAFKQNRGELVVLGARPSHGKSALMFQIASHVAQTKTVLVYSLEMDRESILTRMLAKETGHNIKAIQARAAPQNKVDEAKKELSKLKFFIDDRSLDVRSIRSSANAFHSDPTCGPVGLVIVDYMQIVKASGNKGNRNEEVGDISYELKALAKDLKCPVLVGSQLNRQCEIRGKQTGDYRPAMSDLRESGNIEADADVIIFLSRQEMYDGTKINTAEVNIANNRNGPTGAFDLVYTPASCIFSTRPRKGPSHL